MINIAQELNDKQTCPLCHGHYFLPWKLELIQCIQCNAIYSPKIFLQDANHLLEEQWFGEGHNPKKSFWTKIFELYNNYKTLKRLAVSNINGRKLMEIGVGSGSLLNSAKTKGYEVTGSDLSQAICERVRATYGISVHCGPLEDLTKDDRFDVVIMNHVLEHVQNPIEFLRSVSHLLLPGGIAHIAVPNVACWEATLRGWTSFEPYHLTYFTPQTLRNTIIKSGFTIEQLTTHESFSGWYLAFLRSLLGVNRNNSAINRSTKHPGSRATLTRSMLIEHIYRFAMVTFGTGFWPIRTLQSRLGYGDEIVCIVRKQTTD